MEKSNSVHNPSVLGCKLMKDEDEINVDKTYYKQVVGSLNYLTATRPDIMFVVSLINRYMENPTKLHLQATKKVLRYLKGTTEFRIFYRKEEMMILLHTQTVITLEIWMRERVLQAMCSY